MEHHDGELTPDEEAFFAAWDDREMWDSETGKPGIILFSIASTSTGMSRSTTKDSLVMGGRVHEHEGE